MRIIQHCCFRSRVLILFAALVAVAVQAAEPIDINTASATELADALPGIGPAKARSIVEYRQRHGAFATVDALELVKGIGPRTMQKLRPLVRVDSAVAAPPAAGRRQSQTRSAVKKIIQRANQAALE